MTAVAEFAIPRDAELTSVSLTLPAVLPSARQARAFTANSLGRWGENEELIEAAVLIVCELATNAIRHGARLPAECGRARGPDSVIVLKLTLEPEVLHIEVHDGSAILPVQRTAAHDEDCGRGMLIINALAESWTCGQDPEGGKWVRATLSRAPDALQG
ncbi:ATP-binding protein [Streptomyces inhibens]|uniref:ATP-binding protein n=1 Tax=Streptomyces inhibens TaxID=2293571 RepID=A0A371PVW5_STRIH|nr:ATP-binding protein [Streptomyces inhibens]REK86626.1 ATP-binding protein [Streptomyces inhibens]